VEYGIIEPDEVLRAAQRGTMGDALSTKLWQSGGDIPSRPALFLCNELLDAFPVHRVRWTGDAWVELWVREDATASGGLGWIEGELSDPMLHDVLRPHSAGLPPGYTTEVCLDAGSWVAGVAQSSFTGALLLLDYGFTTEEHFAQERTEGTLRRYHAHRMDDRILENLGDADLTAHVDFTQVAQIAETEGMQVADFIEQGRFLTRLFAESFATAPDGATVRQFHTLTHPNHMGRSFQALVLAKGLDAAVFSSRDGSEAARRRLGLPAITAS
jgi:SAM-dependent MidA family methyltransferase